MPKTIKQTLNLDQEVSIPMEGSFKTRLWTGPMTLAPFKTKASADAATLSPQPKTSLPWKRSKARREALKRSQPSKLSTAKPGILMGAMEGISMQSSIIFCWKESILIASTLWIPTTVEDSQDAERSRPPISKSKTTWEFNPDPAVPS